MHPSHHTHTHHQRDSPKLATPRTTLRFNETLFAEQHFPTELPTNGYDTHHLPLIAIVKSFKILRTLRMGAMTLMREQIKIDCKNNNAIESKTNNVLLVMFSLKHFFHWQNQRKGPCLIAHVLQMAQRLTFALPLSNIL